MAKKGGRRAPPRATTTVSSSQAKAQSVPYAARRIKRHLEELEKSNFTGDSHALAGFSDSVDEESRRGEGSLALSTMKKRKKKEDQSVAVRMLLMYRKSLAELIDESGLASLPKSTPSYLTAVAPPPATPPLRICTVCGYKGIHRCTRCGMEYCDLSCKDVHDETRCERRHM